MIFKGLKKCLFFAIYVCVCALIAMILISCASIDALERSIKKHRYDWMLYYPNAQGYLMPTQSSGSYDHNKIKACIGFDDLKVLRKRLKE